MTFPALLAAIDRAALDLLGGLVRYAPQVGEPVDVRGVFDTQFQHPLGLGGARPPGEVVVGPALFVRLADLPVDPTTDTPVVTVDGVDYRVREVHKDGQGGALLHLLKII